MAKNQIAKKDYSEENAVIFNFADGESVTVNFADFPPATQSNLQQYGIAQKLGDEYAGAEGPLEAREAMTSLIERLKKGEWKQAREGGGGVRTTMLAEALSQVTGQALETCQEKIAEMDEDGRKGLKAHKQVAAAMAVIKAERAQTAATKALEESQAEESPALDF